jgi:SAM-dependent methyltransferase
MDAATYDGWYKTSRGGWIGEIEYGLMHRLVAPAAGENLLDVGCGTGHFTRRFACEGLAVTGIDSDADSLRFAAEHTAGGEHYILGDARALPFPARSFDSCVSITALCFIREQSRALAEMLRVTRRRFAIGLLNRQSLLYRQKGRAGGLGGYRGAHWHTKAEITGLFADLPVTHLKLRTAVFIPSGNRFARFCEQGLPNWLPWGSFLLVAGDVVA